MKNIIAIICLMYSLTLLAAWPDVEEMALYRARQYGAEAKECLRIVDQNGSPVAGAMVWGGLQTGDGYNDFTTICGMTDMNGEYVIKGRCTNRIRCDITKDGYYNSEFVAANYGYRHCLRDGKWQPYGEVTTIELKEIKNPVALTHAKSSYAKPPSLGKWYGYDIERRKWVIGEDNELHADMLVRITTECKNNISDFRTKMEISFTNNAYAGAYMLPVDKHSEMKSVYYADTNATYQSYFCFVYEKHPIIQLRPMRHVSGMEVTDTRLDADSYLVFRTRTEVDSDGRLVSAHYGKIYGVWEFFDGMRAANVQFNPIPNDINLEDAETAECSRRRLRQLEEQR